MIALKNISKCYDHPVLENINLLLQPGFIYVLKGTSGSGKSTLLHLLGALDQVYEGDIVYADCNLKEMTMQELEAYKNQVGYVFQQSLLIPQFTVLENLQMFCDNEDYIVEFAKQFRVEEILASSPLHLSNGERQRIAIIRTLLTNPKILLMDEPTAALDQENARTLLEELKQLRSSDRILIISTHDSIFDEIADIILHMEYGKLTETISTQEIIAHTKPLVEQNVSMVNRSNKMDIMYCIRKHSNLLKRIPFLLAASLFFLINFVSFAFQLNFADAYEGKLEKEYPIQVFSLNKEEYESIKGIDYQLSMYKNYQKEYDKFAIISYLPEEDSSLAIPNAIAFGEFPTNKQEVVVTEAYVKAMYPDEANEQFVGREIEIEGDKYRVSGVLTNDESVLKDVYNANVYYWNIAGPLVFMSDEAIQNYTQAKDDPVIMAKLENEKMSNTIYQSLYEMGGTSYFYRILNEKVYSMNFIFYIIQICMAIIIAMSFVFMYFIIQLDLFHRRQELGYLQIFHIHSKRIKKIVRFDYLLKVLPSFALSIVLYCICITCINQYIGLAMPYDLGLVSILLCIHLSYVLLIVEFPLRKYMKRDVLTLIRD